VGFNGYQAIGVFFPFEYYAFISYLLGFGATAADLLSSFDSNLLL